MWSSLDSCSVDGGEWRVGGWGGGVGWRSCKARSCKAEGTVIVLFLYVVNMLPMAVKF